MEISMLIVDDDRLVTEKLEKTVHFERLGISNVLTASNIRQAMKLLEEMPIQILLSDIEMPQGSGLELLEWIRQKQLPVECMFLSSYAYFSYAQKAMQLNSSEYLVKPVTTEELEIALQRSIKRVEEKEGDHGGGNRNLNLWETFLLAQNSRRQTEAEKELRRIYGDADFSLNFIRIFPDRDHKGKKDAVRFQILVSSHVRKILEGGQAEALIRVDACEWMLIWKEPPGMSLQEKKQELCRCLQRVIAQPVCIYAGSVGTVGELHHSLEHLEQMEMEAVPGDNPVLREGDWLRQESRDAKACFPDENWFAELERSADFMHMQQEILEYTDTYSRENIMKVQMLQAFHKKTTGLIERHLRERGQVLESIFEMQEFESYEKDAYRTMEGWRAFIRFLFEKLEGNQKSDCRQESVVDCLKRYIEENLKEDLSRKTLAAQVYLSEDYISRIFMNAAGMSITSYIASRRMERARKYLEDTALPVSKIAMEVGYSNFSYFSKTFRDWAGVTPNEYRMRKAKERNTLLQ